MGEVHNALVVSLGWVLAYEVRVELGRVARQRAELAIREDRVAYDAGVVVERAVGGHPAVLHNGVMRSSWEAESHREPEASLGHLIDPLPGGYGRPGQRRRGGTVGEQLDGKHRLGGSSHRLAGRPYRHRDADRQSSGQ